MVERVDKTPKGLTLCEDLSEWRSIHLHGPAGEKFLHKEMNLGIKPSFYEVLSKNEIYPAWTIAFQPPPNLMTNPQSK